MVEAVCLRMTCFVVQVRETNTFIKQIPRTTAHTPTGHTLTIEFTGSLYGSVKSHTPPGRYMNDGGKKKKKKEKRINIQYERLGFLRAVIYLFLLVFKVSQIQMWNKNHSPSPPPLSLSRPPRFKQRFSLRNSSCGNACGPPLS